jgi:peptide/nickel transport system permease protein
VGVAIPALVIGLLLASFFAVRLGWFPAVGYTPISEGIGPWARSLVLPWCALAVLPAAETARQLRGSLADELGSRHVLAARAKGMTRRQVVFKHAMRNALLPVTAVLAVRVSNLISGSVIIETVFNLNGLGATAVRATISRDIPVVLGVTLFSAVAVAAISIVVGYILPLLNPKLRAA